MFLVLPNSLATVAVLPVRIRVRQTNVRIRQLGESGWLPQQLQPAFGLPTEGETELPLELWFEARVPPLGATVYVLEEGPAVALPKVGVFGQKLGAEVQQLEAAGIAVQTGATATANDLAVVTPQLSLAFDPKSGLLKGVTQTQQQQRTLPLELQFLQYGSGGSGAYLFLPSEEAQPYLSPTSVVVRTVQGRYVQTVCVQTLNYHHCVRAFNVTVGKREWREGR